MVWVLNVMLNVLRVRDFAIIDELEVELGPGLNVVTGETGAGKSILVQALQLVLGAKGKAQVVRTGSDTAEVEALFELSGNTELKARLAEAGLDTGDDLIIRRVVSAQGRTRAYLNGRLASAAQLRELAPLLADISSQHLAHSLVDPRTHLRFLDAFAGLADDRAEMKAAYQSWRGAARSVEEALELSRDRVEREDLLRFQISEIEEFDPKAGEGEKLGAQRGRLRHAERLLGAAGEAERALHVEDRSICDRLAGIESELQGASSLDPELIPCAQMVSEARTQLEEAARDLGLYARSIELDPNALQRVDDRLQAMRRLERKYGSGAAALMDHRDSAARELAELEHHDEYVEATRKECAACEKSAITIAERLSASRHAAASKLSFAIQEQLRSLGMGDAEVRVELVGAPEADDSTTALSPTGYDQAEFLIAPNRGEAARPLGQIASGGELSRAMLAIKRVLGQVGPGGLYAFDEVDTGVGGAIAEVIGRKLQDVAAHHQVLCITHLPQIAVYGDAHFRVHKDVVDGRTHSQISRLTPSEREEEVARMLGGLKISQHTRDAAKDLIEQAAAH